MMFAVHEGNTAMAKCDQGYLCEVCGEEVDNITQSDLYLRYVIGEVPVRDLLAAPERHLACNPFHAQFIVDPGFPPVPMEGPFAKQNLDPAEVSRLEDLITRGWRRLQELHGQSLPVSDYPLPEIQAAGEQESSVA
ncbi:MAG TPA: hypothetical protein VL132_22785 [Planctomycetaceae bacterium]|nr:hypothetical protein [Planctomycetaceae bacterium]